MTSLTPATLYCYSTGKHQDVCRQPDLILDGKTKSDRTKEEEQKPSSYADSQEEKN